MKRMAILTLAICMLFCFTATAEVELELYGWMTEQESGLTAMVDIFNEKNEGEISVHMSLIPWGTMWQKIQVAANAQDANCADVYATGTQYSYDYARNGWLLDIQDLFDSGAIDLSNFNQASLDPFTVEGKVIGVPKDYDSVAVFYNKAIFDDAGVAYPDGDWTWAEFAETAKKLANAEKGVYGVSVEGDVQCTTASLFASNGGRIWDENNLCVIDSPENVEVMKSLYALIEEGTSPTIDELAEVSSRDRFQNGALGMRMDGSWMTAQYNNVLGENLGITTLPYFDAPKTNINTVAWVGHAYTAHPEEAKALLTYLGSYEAAHATSGVVIPAFKGTDQEWAGMFPNIGVENFFKWQTDGSGFMKPMPTAHGMEAVTIVQSYMTECLYSGEIEANLAAAVAECNAIMN